MIDYEVTLNRCSYHKDDENERGLPCHCQKIERFIVHEGSTRKVFVCRNYYAELFQRYYKDDTFRTKSMAELQIAYEVFGCHIHPSLNKDPSLFDYVKVNGFDIFNMFFIDNSYILHEPSIFKIKGWSYQPILYARLSNKCFVKYPLYNIFSLICDYGTEESYWIFKEKLHDIVRFSIQKMVECLEAKNIRYRKTLVNPILKRLCFDYSNRDRYEIGMINALREILEKIATNKLIY